MLDGRTVRCKSVETLTRSAGWAETKIGLSEQHQSGAEQEQVREPCGFEQAL